MLQFGPKYPTEAERGIVPCSKATWKQLGVPHQHYVSLKEGRGCNFNRIAVIVSLRVELLKDLLCRSSWWICDAFKDPDRRQETV